MAYASRALTSIELNGSFYALQKPESYAGWHAATQDNFIFSIKGNRFITHVKRPREIDGAVANVLASGVYNYGDAVRECPYYENVCADFMCLRLHGDREM